VTIASASVFTEKIKGTEIPNLFLGTNEEVVQRLVSLIENELGEIPPIKLHCPPATVQVFLESISGYLEKEGKKELSSRAKSLIPKISEYYKRGKED
jgi:NifU-like protein involved in Fe-S cluster formation